MKGNGIKAKDRVAILAENSPLWGIIYLATVRLGAIAVPILPDFTEPDVRHILSETKTKLLFTTERQFEKLYDFNHPALKLVVTLDDCRMAHNSIRSQTLNEFMAAAPTLEGEKIDDQAKADDVASIIYTSGTSGHSKAVMLTHKNLCSNVNSARQVIDISEEWIFLSVLPISHAYEFTTGFLLPLSQGASVLYCTKSPTPAILAQVCQAEKPWAICVVPMIMEKIYKKKIMPALKGGKIIPMAMKIPLLRQKILKRAGTKLLDFFGGRLKIMAIGGAALNIEVEKFLWEAGFPYLIGYGLTEASPLLTVGILGGSAITLGSCGHSVPGVEVRLSHIDQDTGVGEIMAKGFNIMMGYYKNPEVTAKTIGQEGWLATGDLARMDKDGNLFITGRSKSVIVLSHGENIFPEAIEEKLNSFVQVTECLVNENNGRLQAIIYPDYEYIDQETKGQSDSQKRDYINQRLKEILDKVNVELPTYSRISKIIERREPFEKTATHKIKRYLYTNN